MRCQNLCTHFDASTHGTPVPDGTHQNSPHSGLTSNILSHRRTDVCMRAETRSVPRVFCRRRHLLYFGVGWKQLASQILLQVSLGAMWGIQGECSKISQPLNGNKPQPKLPAWGPVNSILLNLLKGTSPRTRYTTAAKVKQDVSSHADNWHIPFELRNTNFGATVEQILKSRCWLRRSLMCTVC